MTFPPPVYCCECRGQAYYRCPWWFCERPLCGQHAEEHIRVRHPSVGRKGWVIGA